MPFWLQELIDALNKSGYIRHDLKPLTLRIWWLYTVVSSLNTKERIDWFNHLYENDDDLDDTFCDAVMLAISGHFKNPDYANLVKSWFGLWESGEIPEAAGCKLKSLKVIKKNPEVTCYGPYKTLGKNLPPLPTAL